MPKMKADENYRWVMTAESMGNVKKAPSSTAKKVKKTTKPKPKKK